MILKRSILMTLLLCFPIASVADDYDINKLIKLVSNSTSINEAINNYNSGLKTVEDNYPNVSANVKQQFRKQESAKIGAAENYTDNATTNEETSDIEDNSSLETPDEDSPENTENIQSDLEAKQQAYDEAKAKEQSKENRTLTALTTAATGIGGMQLAQGLAEQKADKAAEQDMSAYIATMRCSYADGKSVKAGTEEIELPGANDSNIMKYRAEYMSLAADLKERKDALGMKPGIESEEIMDRVQMGLYDDENVGISDGAYASLYRAQIQNSDKDQQQIDADKKTSKTRVIAGGVAAGVGVVGGMVGDSLVNGKLGEKIKSAKESAQTEESTTTTK